ncbi:hypothetical protein PPERSA_08174 [Pseudocohnilembus persalinus]|uniref:Uncharacterized protein n=1 Tax=Pseudocohnilembus persalinus TaxID=266149 RepID=A0A0V0R391_PSEPJ|nr:hypothetical protein PPERSA_08174 [Pseudocohnilembus persalinus]|eukprot:KRX08971.1 hypothetical protein PPERSA_08174 [Pseudocohnilembus persalinus]
MAKYKLQLPSIEDQKESEQNIYEDNLQSHQMKDLQDLILEDYEKKKQIYIPSQQNNWLNSKQNQFSKTARVFSNSNRSKVDEKKIQQIKNQQSKLNQNKQRGFRSQTIGIKSNSYRQFNTQQDDLDTKSYNQTQYLNTYDNNNEQNEYHCYYKSQSERKQNTLQEQNNGKDRNISKTYTKVEIQNMLAQRPQQNSYLNTNNTYNYKRGLSSTNDYDSLNKKLYQKQQLQEQQTVDFSDKNLNELNEIEIKLIDFSCMTNQKTNNYVIPNSKNIKKFNFLSDKRFKFTEISIDELDVDQFQNAMKNENIVNYKEEYNEKQQKHKQQELVLNNCSKIERDMIEYYAID